MSIIAKTNWYDRYLNIFPIGVKIIEILIHLKMEFYFNSIIQSHAMFSNTVLVHGKKIFLPHPNDSYFLCLFSTENFAVIFLYSLLWQMCLGILYLDASSSSMMRGVLVKKIKLHISPQLKYPPIHNVGIFSLLSKKSKLKRPCWPRPMKFETKQSDKVLKQKCFKFNGYSILKCNNLAPSLYQNPRCASLFNLTRLLIWVFLTKH